MDKRIRAIAKKNKAAKQAKEANQGESREDMDKPTRAIAKKNKAKEAKKPKESKPATERDPERGDDEPPAVIVGGSAAPSEKASVSKSKSVVSVCLCDCVIVCLFVCLTGKFASAMYCRIPTYDHAAVWCAALENARVGSTCNTSSGVAAATYQSPCSV